MRPFLPECKGLAACGHLFESPLPSGQHLYHFYLDLKDQNELAHPARRPPCPQIGAADVEYTGGGDVFVKSVAQIALVLSLFFRLCPILCSKGHIARVSNSGSGTGTWWFQWPSPSLSFVSSRISHLKKVWAIMIIFFEIISEDLWHLRILWVLTKDQYVIPLCCFLIGQVTWPTHLLLCRKMETD